MRSVAIIGGGIAGLWLTDQLTIFGGKQFHCTLTNRNGDENLSIHLFERNDHLGGKQLCCGPMLTVHR